MEFYFYPDNDQKFKEEALNNFVHTIVFNTETSEVELSFVRKVQKIWEQTCKNNIETDHRIKELSGINYQVYSWVSNSKSNLNLPCFSE